ncbi:coniferyl aldehyde dehydrogenase [Gordonia hankookensis]|uniref:coniferyl aldehyde dehydrogenase n=1 Tax=Gordonia hankookensis TaxID=589403 RepID=UPI002954B14E|nr:coniferyl aldehyde dehydrogenase [Gordonia hankookensis]
MSTVDGTADTTASVSHRDEMLALMEMQRRAFLADGPPDVATRRNRIDRLVALMVDNADALVDALVQDFGSKSRLGTLSTEIVGCISQIEHTRSNIPKWMRESKILRAGRALGIRAEVVPSPLGVVGIIGPWNFPVQLVIVPAVAAFAAGNRVMIKMSEVTAATAELMKTLAAQYFDPAELAVVTGDAMAAADFSSLPFDHLFFTGSPGVGKLVQRAASDNLVPVTLELGGKNPVVVAPDADIRRSASRIALGRMVNGGQVCVCPDYVFVPNGQIDAFVTQAKDTLAAAFPSVVDDPQYPASVNQANFDRVIGLIEDARRHGARVETVVPQGEDLPDPDSRKIPPTIVRDVDDRMRIAHEEIFGPVLVVKPYDRLSDVVDHVNARPAPLVTYWFGPDRAAFREYVRHTRSGGVARNEFGLHMLPAAAPFGGVGNSGMGAYHGKAGFDTFSHYRTVVGSDLPFSVTTSSAVQPFSRAARTIAAITIRSARRRTRRRLGGDGQRVSASVPTTSDLR